MRIDRQRKAREMAERIQAVRQECFGGDMAQLAEALHIPERTWRNYEAGVTMPAEIMLAFLVLCDTDPLWMLNGHARAELPCPRAANQSGTRSME